MHRLALAMQVSLGTLAVSAKMAPELLAQGEAAISPRIAALEDVDS